MKYTALFMIILGIVIACCAGVLYASVGADREENLFSLGVAVPVVCAIALVSERELEVVKSIALAMSYQSPVAP